MARIITHLGYHTRTDLLESIWAQELIPMLNAYPGVKAVALLEHLQRQYLEQYPEPNLFKEYHD